jgi:two-component system chemotaxis response regulator CheY
VSKKQNSAGKRIDCLIVDDSRAMQSLVENTLKKTKFRLKKVRKAGDGNEALQILKSGYRPDVVISDWKMPNVDGFEFLESVRFGYPDLLFGFVTSQKSEQVENEARKAGADFFVTKPFNPEDLTAALEPYLT